MKNRANDILSKINELAAISDQSNCITRTFGSPAFKKCNQKIFEWFTQEGLQTHIDNIGNVRGRLACNNPKAKTLVIASHADTVVNAGRFDGPLGILTGLHLVSKLAKQKDDLPFNIELISFCDEEGVRFHTTYLGSKVVAGSFEKELLQKKDARDISLQQAIEDLGGDVSKLPGDAILPADWLGYFEIHIEQGPVLYNENIPVGIVTSIAGQQRANITLTGENGHAGTVPMQMRNDALCCAAECITRIENFAQTNPAIIATVGTLNILNAASNVIPGQVTFSLDLRGADKDDLDTAWQAIGSLIKDISQKRKIIADIQLVQSSLPVKCDYHLNFLLKRAITQLGYPVKELMSGAGHDAVAVSHVSPVCMLFVNCYKGISHNPKEQVDIKDIEAVLAVSDLFLQQVINYYNQP